MEAPSVWSIAQLVFTVLLGVSAWLIKDKVKSQDTAIRDIEIRIHKVEIDMAKTATSQELISLERNIKHDISMAMESLKADFLKIFERQ